MKPYLFTITVFAFAVLCGCKSEYVKPQSATVSVKNQNNTPASTSGNTSTSGTVSYIDPSKLIGKWSLAKDSTSWCIGADTMIHSKVYVGTADDYFDFRTNGKVYIKENGVLDSMSFGMPTDTTVIFGKSNGVWILSDGTATPIPTLQNIIDPFTNNSARITYNYGANPGGIFRRTVYLTR